MKIKIYLCRSWQARRVVWTKDMLVCSQIEMSTVLDAISLAEVLSVQFVQDPAFFGHQASKLVSYSRLLARVFLVLK